jgi:hypothetical protein
MDSVNHLIGEKKDPGPAGKGSKVLFVDQAYAFCSTPSPRLATKDTVLIPQTCFAPLVGAQIDARYSEMAISLPAARNKPAVRAVILPSDVSAGFSIVSRRVRQVGEAGGGNQHKSQAHQQRFPHLTLPPFASAKIAI